MASNTIMQKLELLAKITIKLVVNKLCYAGRWPMRNKVVIVSTGRAGSTMLTLSIADSLVSTKTNVLGKAFPKLARWASLSFARRLLGIESVGAIVIKSHDVFDDRLPENWKFIFIHGDPLDSVSSVERMVKAEGVKWFAQHQDHLRGNGAYEDRYQNDVLNYKGQLLAWSKEHRANILTVAYEDLWDKADEISDFIGLLLKLPSKEKRSSKKTENAGDHRLFTDLRMLRTKLTGYIPETD